MTSYLSLPTLSRVNRHGKRTILSLTVYKKIKIKR